MIEYQRTDTPTTDTQPVKAETLVLTMDKAQRDALQQVGRAAFARMHRAPIEVVDFYPQETRNGPCPL